MTLLSILIPIESADLDPRRLVGDLIRHPSADLEFVLSPASPAIADALDLTALAQGDPRIKLAHPSGDLARMQAWNQAFVRSSGQWLTLVRPNDTIDPELIRIIRHIEAKAPETDGFAWNALQIAADAIPGQASSVAIPTGYSIIDFDKTDMLKAFFLWEGSHNVPKMPFGLFHAALNRRLAQTVHDSIVASGRNPSLPQWEWAARTALLGEKFAFCARPLSIVDMQKYPPPQIVAQTGAFPFHDRIGQTAAIAEIQNAVFEEMGAAWVGMEENFIRALIIDCMLEPDPERFNLKCSLTYNALKQWQGGRFATMFKPQFAGSLPPDLRRGLQGSTLMIDRHIAGARNAPEFYEVIRHFLAPVGVICGAQAA